MDFLRGHNYHPVIHLPEDYEVYDFSESYDPSRDLKSPFGIGKFNEKRPGMYKGEHYEAEQRDIHMGIDIGAPIGTEVHSFYEGEVFLFGYNPKEWDYGNTLITRHIIGGKEVYALHGHLSSQSLENKTVGQKIEAGEVVAYVGDKTENGGWNPHLHFQLSLKQPETFDMPGVVNDLEREQALKIYLDPRLVLGELYD